MGFFLGLRLLIPSCHFCRLTNYQYVTPVFEYSLANNGYDLNESMKPVCSLKMLNWNPALASLNIPSLGNH
jgi:hypothetical protein